MKTLSRCAGEDRPRNQRVQVSIRHVVRWHRDGAPSTAAAGLDFLRQLLTTIAGPDGSRQPSANELAGARHQGELVARIANRLHS